jgi:hypothetical protein
MLVSRLPIKPLILALAASLALGSCALAGKQARAVLALDEAFVAARPGLAGALRAPRAFGKGPFGLLSPVITLPIGLGESPAKAVDAARAEAKRSGGAAVLVASPLVARAIAEGGAWSGDPPILSPEYRGADPAAPNAAGPHPFSVYSDPEPAYAAAGRAAGAYISELGKTGGEPVCGILYAESPARPRAALEAFTAAYASASGGRRLELRELSPTATDTEAEAAVADLLGSDLRLLLVALGAESETAIKKATRPGLAIGLDSPEAAVPQELAFRIEADDEGLTRALAAESRRIARLPPDAASRGGALAVPARLVAEAGAASIAAGRIPFSRFVSDATLGAQGKVLSH